MPGSWTGRYVHEAVGVFHDADDFQAAIDELLTAGFDHADVSVIAGRAQVERRLGRRVERLDQLADDPSVPRTAYVSTESRGDVMGVAIGATGYLAAVAVGAGIIATGGSLPGAAVAAAMAGIAGGLLGSVPADIINRRHANLVADQLAHGGLVLWVHTRDADHERRAKEILTGNSATGVHVHAMPVSA